jgi:hypothetical protein
MPEDPQKPLRWDEIQDYLRCIQDAATGNDHEVGAELHLWCLKFQLRDYQDDLKCHIHVEHEDLFWMDRNELGRLHDLIGKILGRK